MATPIKRIEKDFLLKVLYDEKVPIMCLLNRTEYIFMVDQPAKDEISFKTDRPVAGIKPKRKLNLLFDYRGQVIIFSVEVVSVKEDRIIAIAPEFLYKNLDRSYSRVVNPPDLQVHMIFLGDRYSLTYPKVTEFERDGDMGHFIETVDPKNLSDLVAQIASWIKGYATGYKLVIFKDVKPSSMEERILAETGKTLYLPATTMSLPETDPYPKKRLITEEIFQRYLESTGVDPAFLEDALARFVKSKADAGFLSDAWIPILFQEYVIGYIHIWINEEGQPPFNYDVIDTLYQFAKILAFSLKENGYFEAGRLKNEPFEGKIVDISASGMLFAYPHSALSSALMPDTELKLRLTTPNQVINTNARIVRRYRDNIQGFFGCRFLDMMPEDLRYLFEYIYGKPFTDEDASFLTGQV